MSDKKTGGPAFPALIPWEHSDVQGKDYPDYSESGMTLRDYFAAKAMQGIVSSIDGEENYQRLRTLAAETNRTVSQWIAKDAYKQADAMLAERDK